MVARFDSTHYSRRQIQSVPCPPKSPQGKVVVFLRERKKGAANADKHNVDGTLGCLTPFGDYAGGTLVFPRFGVRAEVNPHDLLIADTNEELHGNLGPIVGQRYSIVACLHRSLEGAKR